MIIVTAVKGAESFRAIQWLASGPKVLQKISIVFTSRPHDSASIFLKYRVVHPTLLSSTNIYF